jgi:RNA ligase (TIGR02306 family)
MSSDLIVPVVEIKNVRIHPNADMLSLCDVLGYQMVNGLIEDPEGEIVRWFRRGERDERGRRVPWDKNDDCEREEDYEEVRYSYRYKDGDLGVYFPADTILTPEWAKEFEVEHLLQGKEANRVGRCRLRGEPSFGLVVGLPDGVDWKLGDNVADYYDAKKWEPDPDQQVAPDAAPYDSNIDPHFVKYTDIQNGLLLYDRFQSGEEVVVSEKIHGKNCRIGLINGVLQVGSRTTRKDHEKLRDKSVFWGAVSDNIEQMLRNITEDHGANVVILFGEVYGQGVQSLHYGCKKQKGFRAFDIYVDGDYLDYELFRKYCDLYKVERVPILAKMPFDLDKVKGLSSGRSVLPGADNIMEGVVVRTAVERRDTAWGRVVMKFISPDYDLSKHKKKDTTDV